ncbi:MAG: hypothetical protein JETT_3721 [Candidatus Jettenia ecosi]|uniref:Uncharacterized protein n=1 Tax=Candidatus Jettenia ecosi TaxID=2494326 RepID=A0A533QBN7_9BACT|nr:MAG: hypothetical protein JETT_3721 [Candidatus Jettenia ecosi]
MKEFRKVLPKFCNGTQMITDKYGFFSRGEKRCSLPIE